MVQRTFRYLLSGYKGNVHLRLSDKSQSILL